MDIMYTLGKLTGKATKAVVSLTGSTIGSSARGFKDAFANTTDTIITPEQPAQTSERGETLGGYATQAEFDFDHPDNS